MSNTLNGENPLIRNNARTILNGASFNGAEFEGLQALSERPKDLPENVQCSILKKNEEQEQPGIFEALMKKFISFVPMSKFLYDGSTTMDIMPNSDINTSNNNVIVTQNDVSMPASEQRAPRNNEGRQQNDAGM